MESSGIVAPYNSPPIVEAVIGINFENELKDKEVTSISKKFASYYSSNQSIKNVAVNLEIDQAKKSSKTPNTTYTETLGRKLSYNDMTELLVIWPSTFTFSQLAPYSGWDDFFGRFVRDWKIWKRANKYRKISRIGVRYINRIDIPFSDSEIKHEEFLNIYPKVPGIIPTLDAYSINIVAKLSHIGCNLKINSSVVPPPLLNHTSFLIDQDIHISSSLPQKDDDIYALLNLIRIEKNKVFESCISDKARELFQK